MSDVRLPFRILRGVIFIAFVIVIPLGLLRAAIVEEALPVWERIILGVVVVPALVIGLRLMALLKTQKKEKWIHPSLDHE